VNAKKDEILAIGDVSRLTAIPASTLRYYESAGLIPRAERRGGKRRYRSTDLTQLFLIRLAKAAGFTIAEIRTLMNGFGRKTPPGQRWRTLGKKKLVEIEKQIHELESIKQILEIVTKCECPSFEDCVKATKLRRRS